MTKDASQEVLNNLKAGGNISIGNVDVGDQHHHYGSREITVSGVGGTPPSFERYWVNRISYQERLATCISTTPVTEIVAAGGFGKSSLAAWAFENLKGGFQKRLWVSFGQPRTFDRVARWILQEIGFPYRDLQANEEMLLSELLYRLNDPNPPVKTLVVLDQLEMTADSADHAWFEQFLSQWAEEGKESRVLVTTRSAFLAQDSIALTGMDVDEGSAFLTQEGLTGDRFSDLITLAKGHPLLLKLAASWTIETYDARVDDRAIDFFTKLFTNYTGDPKAGVEAIFEVIFRALPPALQNLLCGLSVYRLPIDVAMAQAMDETATGEDLEQLAGQGLLLLQGTRFVLHPLVAGLVRARVTEEVRRDGHERAIDYYSENYQPWDGTIGSCREELENFYHACELGQYQRAIEILDRCFNQLELAGEWRSLLPLYERLTGEWNAVDESEEKNLGSAWTRSGNLHQDLGNIELAIDAHLKAQAIFDRLDFPEGKAPSLGNLGIAYQSLGDYQKAIDFHSQHNELAQAIGDKRGIAASLGNLGNAYQSLGDDQKAIDFHSQSIEIKQTIGDKKGIANSLGSLGIAYDSLGDYQKATDFHSQSIEIKQAIGDKAGVAVSFFNLGNALGKLDEHFNALQNYIKAKEIYEDLKLDNDVEDCKNAIRNCNQIIAAQRRTPPTLDDGYKSKPNYKKRQDRKRLRILLFCVGIAIVFLIAWLKK